MSLPLEQLSAQIPGSTPALLEWIRTQLQAGHAPTQLLRSLEQAGWQRHIAHSAVDMLHTQSLPAPKLMHRPYVDLSQLASTLEISPQPIQVLLSLEKPHLVLLGNVLSHAECDQLIEDARPAMARSKTVSTQSQGEEVNPDRTSDGMFFQRGQTPLIQTIEARLAKLLNWPLENGEGLQVLNYRPGAQYKPHHDFFNPEEPSSAPILRRGGQRVATLVMYLNDVPAGGCTYFPETQLRVHPRKGHAVFFSYATPHAHTLTLHGGDPVISGEKWIATKWLRAHRFD